jgi:hypothetical protein
MLNPLRSYVQHSLQDADPGPAPSLELRDLLGGRFALVCTPRSEREEGLADCGEWIQTRDDIVCDLEEAR